MQFKYEYATAGRTNWSVSLTRSIVEADSIDDAATIVFDQALQPHERHKYHIRLTPIFESQIFRYVEPNERNWERI